MKVAPHYTSDEEAEILANWSNRLAQEEPELAQQLMREMMESYGDAGLQERST